MRTREIGKIFWRDLTLYCADLFLSVSQLLFSTVFTLKIQQLANWFLFALLGRDKVCDTAILTQRDNEYIRFKLYSFWSHYEKKIFHLWHDLLVKSILIKNKNKRLYLYDMKSFEAWEIIMQISWLHIQCAAS